MRADTDRNDANAARDAAIKEKHGALAGRKIATQQRVAALKELKDKESEWRAEKQRLLSDIEQAKKIANLQREVNGSETEDTHTKKPINSMSIEEKKREIAELYLEEEKDKVIELEDEREESPRK